MNPIIRRPMARNMLAVGFAAGAWLGFSALSAAVAQDAAATETPVHYSAEQADRGEEDYTDNCEECHGDDLNGGLLGGAPLKGLAFEEKYGKGAPAGVLFEVMSTTMPPNAPGRYSAAVYADLMSYILKRNGYKAGAELPSDIDALYELSMVK